MADNAKMWRLDTSPYEVTRRVDGQPVTQPYDVKGSYATILFNPALQLTVPQSFEAKDLVDRINAAGDYLLIDKTDLMRLQRAVDALRAPSMDDLVLLSRIRDIPVVEVAEVAPA